MMHTAALVGSPQCRVVKAITAAASVVQWQAKAMLGTNPERPPATLTAESSDGLLPSRLITQRPGAIKRLILPHTAKVTAKPLIALYNGDQPARQADRHGQEDVARLDVYADDGVIVRRDMLDEA